MGDFFPGGRKYLIDHRHVGGMNEVHARIAELFQLRRQTAQTVQVMDVHPATAEGIWHPCSTGIDQHLGLQKQGFQAFWGPLEANRPRRITAFSATATHVRHPLRSRGNGIGVTNTLGRFQRGIDAHTANGHAGLALKEFKQDVHLDYLLRCLHFRQDDAIQLWTSNGFQVLAGQSRLQAVHPHKQGVRLNGLETGLTGEDLEAVTCPQLYGVILPKVQAPQDVVEVDILLKFFERKAGMAVGSVGIKPSLETGPVYASRPCHCHGF